MANFNQIILLGNIVNDPQMRYLPSQTPVVEFRMACNRKWRDQQGQDHEEAMFIDCVAFGKQAEVINQYCQKGNLFFVQGRLQYDTWEDKQGGGKRSKHKVFVENFQLMPRREGGAMGAAPAEGGSQAAPPPARRPMPPRGAAPQAAQQAPYDDQQQFKEDDIPF